jgi:hypothetical protein
MKKAIIITSIFNPTEAIKKFSKIKDYQVIVVGDKKSPEEWKCDNVKFLSIKGQEELDYNLNKFLPYNHYCRKMIGYLYAIKNGAELIVDTDDDNTPQANWDFPEFNGEYHFIPDDLGFINIYELYTKQKIWPRGFPLNKILSPRIIKQEGISKKQVNVGIWQGLADGDPDVDAIYRLTSNQLCTFDKNYPYVLGKNSVTPFNSQNTAFRKELFALLYLPSYVTFRFTDILRGLVAQPIMWLYDYSLGFTEATVVQDRNPHNYMSDFESEIPMYLNIERVIELVSGAISPGKSIGENLFEAYNKLEQENIVCSKEIKVLESWLSEIKIV